MPVSVSRSFFITGPISVQPAGKQLLGRAVDLVVDLTDWGDNRRGAAQAALNELAAGNFLPGDVALVDRHAQILRNLNKAATRDGRQDGVGVGLRHHERAVLLHEQHVCAARFLNVGARLGVEIEVLA